MIRTRSVVVALALALVATGCAIGGDSDSTGPTGFTALGPTTTAPTGPTGGTGTTGAELEDGRHFGFIKSIDPNSLSVEFDLAYFLTGDAANAAAEEHGDETPVPNDYYIVNDNPKIRTLGLGPSLEIVLLDWDHCCDQTIVADLQTFAVALESDEPSRIDGQTYYGPLSPYWLTVEAGTVTRIEEQYLP